MDSKQSIVASSRGKLKACLSTFVKRKSRYLIAQVVDNRKSSTFNLHCFKAFEFISNKLIKTFTVDRCLFRRSFYFLSKGTNKNTNGLLREFYTKRFDFSTITQNELDIVVNIINNKPPNILGIKHL